MTENLINKALTMFLNLNKIQDSKLLMKIFQLADEHGDICSSVTYFQEFNFSKRLKILDIGCRYGSFIYNLYKRGYERVYGVDIDKQVIEKGKRNYKLVADRIILSSKRALFEEESFDVITMWDVIEHLESPEKVLKREVYPYLKPRGWFIFQTPNKYSNIIWEVVQHKNLFKWREFHPSLQSPSSLGNLIKKVGFENCTLEKRNIDSEYKRNKVRKKLGKFGLLLLNLWNFMPLGLTTNLWGYARKQDL